MSSKTYRPEIDGLRAIAVISVILFHAGLSAFQGGFVGVDIFFVISGYLITTILLKDLAANNFSLLHFYERRARRILPALFFVMLACIPFAWFWLLPKDIRSFAESLIAAITFWSNIHFLIETDYFSASTEMMPLLHTWSLAVEEQYYVFFPLFLMVVWSWKKQALSFFLVSITILSFVLMLWGISHKPIATFYLLPTRGWELLLGAILAYFVQQKPPSFTSLQQHTGSIIGLSCILFSILFFNKESAFPNLCTLVPTAGAALVILFATPSTYVYAFLSSKLLTGIGLISYSAYLWHQPIFAFTRYRFTTDLPTLMIVLLTTLTLCLAYLTWKYVEQPFRKSGVYTRRVIFRNSVICAATLFLISLVLLSPQLNMFRFTTEQLYWASFQDYPYIEVHREGECHLPFEQNYRDYSKACTENKKLFVWGDSHAAALSYGLHQLTNASQLSASGCPPIINRNIKSVTFGENIHCQDINNYVMASLTKLQPQTIVLHAAWNKYTLEDVYAFKHTLIAIRNNIPQAEIIVIGGLPQWEKALSVLLLRKNPPVKDIKTIMYSENDTSSINYTDETLQSIIQTIPADSINFIALTSILCQDHECVSVINSDSIEPITWDYGHLTKTGSLYTAKLLLPLIVRRDDTQTEKPSRFVNT